MKPSHTTPRQDRKQLLLVAWLNLLLGLVADTPTFIFALAASLALTCWVSEAKAASEMTPSEELIHEDLLSPRFAPDPIITFTPTQANHLYSDPSSPVDDSIPEPTHLLCHDDPSDPSTTTTEGDQATAAEEPPIAEFSDD